MGAIINAAVSWTVGIANDDSHGYDQANRWSPDYDCSSLIIQAWENAGVPVKTKGATYTGNMYSIFKSCGFKDVTNSVNLATGSGLQKGDVVLNVENHVEMMCSPTQLVGANLAENGTVIAGQPGDQTGREIYIKSYYNYPWDYVLRYSESGSEGSGVTKDDVINKNAYLTLEEMKINAQYVADFLFSRGWSQNAIAGILGNMQTESNINPGLWESLIYGNTAGGYGLVQWTPTTKLINWANAKGLDYTDIDTQLLKLIDEVESGGQYYETTNYPISFQDFIVSTESPEYLAKAFIYNYERPASYDTAETRAQQARYWYINLVYGGSVTPSEPIKKGFKKLFLYAIASELF